MTWVDLHPIEIHRPQGILLKGGGLACFREFRGTAEHAKDDPWIGKGTDGQDHEVKVTEIKDHPCKHAKAQRTPRMYKLELNGQNLCAGELYTANPELLDDQDACKDYAADIDGWAVAVPGGWSTGAYVYSTEVSTLACVSGLVSKCLQWGYDPTDPHSVGYFAACIAASRANYDPKYSFASQGTIVDIYDKANINPVQPRAGETFESAWGWDETNKEVTSCTRRARFSACRESDPECPFRLSAPTECRDPMADENHPDWGPWLIGVRSMQYPGECPCKPNDNQSNN